MGREGIGVAVNYWAIHLLTYLRDKLMHNEGDFPTAEDIGDRTISLPFYFSYLMKKLIMSQEY